MPGGRERVGLPQADRQLAGQLTLTGSRNVDAGAACTSVNADPGVARRTRLQNTRTAVRPASCIGELLSWCNHPVWWSTGRWPRRKETGRRWSMAGDGPGVLDVRGLGELVVGDARDAR